METSYSPNTNKKVEHKLDTLTFSQASLREDDIKVKYYTGLAKFAVLMAIFNFLSPSMESGNRSVLKSFSAVHDSVDEVSP